LASRNTSGPTSYPSILSMMPATHANVNLDRVKVGGQGSCQRALKTSHLWALENQPS
jgi:hypothetical protein